MLDNSIDTEQIQTHIPDNTYIEDTMLQRLAVREIMDTYRETMHIMREAELALCERQEQRA